LCDLLLRIWIANDDVTQSQDAEVKTFEGELPYFVNKDVKVSVKIPDEQWLI
jgi:hypothetical protein